MANRKPMAERVATRLFRDGNHPCDFLVQMCVGDIRQMFRSGFERKRVVDIINEELKQEKPTHAKRKK